MGWFSKRPIFCLLRHGQTCSCQWQLSFCLGSVYKQTVAEASKPDWDVNNLVMLLKIN